jgi:hypothetical protein
MRSEFSLGNDFVSLTAFYAANAAMSFFFLKAEYPLFMQRLKAEEHVLA